MLTRLEKIIAYANLAVFVIAAVVFLWGWAAVALVAPKIFEMFPSEDRLTTRGGEHGLMKPEAQGFGNDLLREASNQDELTFHTGA